MPDISVTQVVNPELSQLQPQTSTNYQAGVVYHGGRVVFDADVYYIDFKNKLQTVSVPLAAGGSDTVNFNLGGAIYKGVEGTITVQATDRIFVFANGSINSAKAEGAATTIDGVAVTIAGGKQIAGAPESTAALKPTYQGRTLDRLDRRQVHRPAVGR